MSRHLPPLAVFALAVAFTSSLAVATARSALAQFKISDGEAQELIMGEMSGGVSKHGNLPIIDRARRAYAAISAAARGAGNHGPLRLGDTVASEHRALPAMIVVAVAENESPEIREEDYAAAMMGVQNLALAAVALGLGTHVKTGAVMSDPAARAAAGVKDSERIVAIVNLGEPAEVPQSKKREPAPAFTIWRP